MLKLICLPAHILDAHITPRAREVLMLLASLTSAENPTLWICRATIAERLRCSPATVGRAIQQLIEAKLIAETGQLHQGRYKFYYVRWSCDENIKAVSKKITKPVRKVAAPMSFEGVQLTLPPVAQLEALRPEVAPLAPAAPPAQPQPAPPAQPLVMTERAMLGDPRLAAIAERVRKQWEENKRRYGTGPTH